MREKTAARGYAEYRVNPIPQVAETFAAQGLPYAMRSALRFKAMLEAERPTVLPDERIALFRTVPAFPDIFTHDERKSLESKFFMPSMGRVCNINPNYGDTISRGFLAKKAECEESLGNHASDPGSVEFLNASIMAVDAALEFCERLGAEAERLGKHELATALGIIPARGATSFFEACQFFRILNYLLWINGNHHNTIGRFDQYMYPYYKEDIGSGAITEQEAYELVLETFLSVNKDTELYHGIQQGDNGQSLVLGGCDRSGGDAVNDLTKLCLRASLEINLIDPKINLRVGKNTPDWLYELGTELTAKGLGFPQYENDDVVIPGLAGLGYDIGDARDYVVAACWEFIIPGKGMEIPNIDCLNFPKIVNNALYSSLEGGGDFDSLLIDVRRGIQNEIDSMVTRHAPLFLEPSPFMSLLMDGCVESGRDVSKGCKYNNYGIHGAGVATAADSLAAVEKLVYDTGAITKIDLLDALRANFEGYDELRSKLLNDAPKMGNNDDAADRFAVILLDWFAEALQGRRNERGGVYRAGTGTAMFYLWSAGDVGATADGRLSGEPFGANFSPSLNTRPDGPLSVIQSFAKPNLEKVINGGPLTLELHDTLFRNKQGITKTAFLVKSYIGLGGHQIQLNAISRDTLLDAQKQPEKYRNLIVRVWGWSGYFIELDPQYQDHIIRRVEFLA